MKKLLLILAIVAAAVLASQSLMAAGLEDEVSEVPMITIPQNIEDVINLTGYVRAVRVEVMDGSVKLCEEAKVEEAGVMPITYLNSMPVDMKPFKNEMDMLKPAATPVYFYEPIKREEAEALEVIKPEKTK